MTISDADGTSEHAWAYDALKVEYVPKIGTVVITDLRVADLPGRLPKTAEFNKLGLSLEAVASGWTVENADGDSYSDKDTVFYLSLKGPDVIVHAS